jgi:hypothetical protein
MKEPKKVGPKAAKAKKNQVNQGGHGKSQGFQGIFAQKPMPKKKKK